MIPLYCTKLHERTIERTIERAQARMHDWYQPVLTLLNQDFSPSVSHSRDRQFNKSFNWKTWIVRCNALVQSKQSGKIYILTRKKIVSTKLITIQSNRLTCYEHTQCIRNTLMCILYIIDSAIVDCRAVTIVHCMQIYVQSAFGDNDSRRSCSAQDKCIMKTA